MDERTLFDRFHEALDTEPRPGAFERLRTQLTNQPVALKRRPAFRMRFSKMGIRMVAALAAVLIAIALIATFITVHNHAVGGIPATDPNVKAFRALIVADYNAMSASTSNHCGTIDDAGCAAALVPVVNALQKWADDLKAFPNTPPQYRVLSSALRAHLLDVINDASALVAFQKAGDAAGFNFVQRGVSYQRAWVDPASFVMEGAYQGGATSVGEAIATARRAVQGCGTTTPGPDVFSCNRLAKYGGCDAAQKSLCEGDLENAETLIQRSLVDMAKNPSSRPTYMRLQQDLAKGDLGLLAIHDALLGGGDSSAINTAETAFVQGLLGANNDLTML